MLAAFQLAHNRLGACHHQEKAHAHLRLDLRRLPDAFVPLSGSSGCGIFRCAFPRALRMLILSCHDWTTRNGSDAALSSPASADAAA